MQIDGEWLVCDDGIVRPVIRGAVLAANGSWVPVPFLLDTGADRTVCNVAVLAALSAPALSTSERLSGLGGTVRTVSIQTRVRFSHEESRMVVFRGSYAAITDLEALDMSVLGRDITNMFAVVVDRPGNVVCLLGQRHQYRIVRR
jgi:predicted aspartyl protease